MNSERRKNESPSLLTEPEIGAFQNIGPPTFAGYVCPPGSPTIAPFQPDVPSRSQYARLPHSVDIPETSHLLTEPEVGAFQNIGSPTITPSQPDFPSRLQYVLTYFSEDDLEDLPPSYSSLEPSFSTLPPSYSTLDVLQAGPEYFKT